MILHQLYLFKAQKTLLVVCRPHYFGMIPIQLHLVMKLNPIILQTRRHRKKLVNCIQLRFSAQKSMLVNYATIQLYRRQIHVKT